MALLNLSNEKLINIAKEFDTPCYVYSQQLINNQWQAFDLACGNHPHLICYAVKANSNISVLKSLAQLGSGFDIVSGGELARVLTAGGNPEKIIFSGVGKQDEEIMAALHANIGCFNVESAHELNQVNNLAKSVGKIAPIALRINPDIPIQTHPYIATGLKENKFGIPFQEAIALYQHAASLSHIKIVGIACHLGSQIMTVEPYLLALQMLLQLIDALAKKNIIVSHLDLGGGFAVQYQDEKPSLVKDFIAPIIQQLEQRRLKLLLEPGRAIVAAAGVLLTKVISLKSQSEKNFAIVDAGMNDLLRPALYEAWHDIVSLQSRHDNLQIYDIVGPVCESGDFIGIARQLSLQPNDILAVTHCGAYGFVMSSNYNTRPRAAEVMIDDNHAYLIRRRETIAELLNNEILNSTDLTSGR
jgi:diaminopimelate decarboxylase